MWLGQRWSAWLWTCSFVFRVPHAKEERNLGSQVSAFICLSFQLYLAHGQSEPGSVWETWLRGRNLLLGGFSPARETKPNTLGLGTTPLLWLERSVFTFVFLAIKIKHLGIVSKHLQSLLYSGKLLNRQRTMQECVCVCVCVCALSFSPSWTGQLSRFKCFQLLSLLPQTYCLAS